MPAGEHGGGIGLIDNKNVVMVDEFRRYCENATDLKMAVGYFYVSGFDLVKDKIRTIKSIRVIMGDETDEHTAGRIELGHQRRIERKLHRELDQIDDGDERMIESLKDLEDFIEKNRLEVKVYNSNKFHAKAYIFESLDNRVYDAAIVGSSNFSKNGMTGEGNIELNSVHRDYAELDTLRKWFEDTWNISDNFKEGMLKIIQRSQPYIRNVTNDPDYLSPTELFKVMIFEMLNGRIAPDNDVLAEFQKIGYENALDRLRKFNGCMISDSVGLGKTFIGLRLIEEAQERGKNVLLLVPKNVKDNWRREMRRNFDIEEDKSRLMVMTITELSNYDLRDNSDRKEMDRIKREYDYVVIDEAHRLRNRGVFKEDSADSSYSGNKNYANLDYMRGQGKQYVLLTATPLNNSVSDLSNLLGIFLNDNILTQGNPELEFASFESYAKAQKDIKNAKKEITPNKDRILQLENDRTRHLDEITRILEDVMILRTRTDINSKYPDLKIDGKSISFTLPKINPKQYELPSSYVPIYEDLEDLLSNLHVPHILLRSKNGGKNLLGLYMILLYKRLESSIFSFAESISRLRKKEEEFMATIKEEGLEIALTGTRNPIGLSSDTDEELEDIAEEYSDGHDREEIPDENTVKEWIEEDLNTIKELEIRINNLREQDGSMYSYEDPKLDKLKEILQISPHEKILVFSQYVDTIEYLYNNLKEDPRLQGKKIDYVTGSQRSLGNTTTEDISRKISLFAPDANNYNLNHGEQEIDILLATDSISEGVNLQDCARVVNYDLPWNPMRIVQRVGRVDRIGNTNVTHVFNILPDKNLDKILALMEKLSEKIDRITAIVGKENYILTEDGEDINPRTFGERIVEIAKADRFETYEMVGRNRLLEKIKNDETAALRELRLRSFIDSLPFNQSNLKKYEREHPVYSIIEAGDPKRVFAMFRIFDKVRRKKIKNVTVCYDLKADKFEEMNDIDELRLYEFPSGIPRKLLPPPPSTPDIPRLLNRVTKYFENNYYAEIKKAYNNRRIAQGAPKNKTQRYFSDRLDKISSHDVMESDSDITAQRARDLKHRLDDYDLNNGHIEKFVSLYLEPGTRKRDIPKIVNKWDNMKIVSILEAFYKEIVKTSADFVSPVKPEDIESRMICWGAFV